MKSTVRYATGVTLTTVNTIVAHGFFNPPKTNGTNQLAEDFGGCSNFQTKRLPLLQRKSRVAQA